MQSCILAVIAADASIVEWYCGAIAAISQSQKIMRIHIQKIIKSHQG